MGARGIALAALCTLVLPGAARADGHQSYTIELRVQHLEAALAALGAIPVTALHRADAQLRALARGACTSEIERLKIECLISAARRYCKERPEQGTSCPSAMDVMLGNLLGEEQLVPMARQIEILGRSSDRREIDRELHRVRAALAADFQLRTGGGESDVELARKIDDYCLRTAHETLLSWQTCAASLVWFVRVPRAAWIR